MDTLVFGLSLIASRADWDRRLAPWLRHHRDCGLEHSAFLLVDDGSTWLPEDLSVTSAFELGRVSLPGGAGLVQFHTALGEGTRQPRAGAIRGFGCGLTLAQAYGFGKVVYLPTDGWLLSPRLIEYINMQRTGWTTFNETAARAPDQEIHVICEDAFSTYRVLRDAGPFAGDASYPCGPMPWLRVETRFKGEAFGAADARLSMGTDFVVRVPQNKAFDPPPAVPRRSLVRRVFGEKPRAQGVAARAPRSQQQASPLEISGVDRLHDEGSYAEALRALTVLAEKYPEDGSVIGRQGVLSYLQAEETLARVFLEKAVAIKPADALAQQFLAAVRMDDGELLGAVCAALDAAFLDPDSVQILIMAGAFLVQAGRFTDAVPLLSRAIDLDANEGSALVNLAAIPWGNPAVKSAYPDGMRGFEALARERLIDALVDGTLNEAGAATLISLKVTNGREFSKIRQLADAMFRRGPADASLAFSLGKLFGIAGDAVAALEAFRVALSLAPESVMFKNALAYQEIVVAGEHWQRGFRESNETWPSMNPSAYLSRPARWRGEPLEGALLVYQEQGIGDALLALRLVPDLVARGLDVLLWVHPTFRELASSVAAVRMIDAPKLPDAAAYGVAAVTPLFGLIDALGASAASVRTHPTRLKAPLRDFPGWPKITAPSRRLKIGLCLLGNPRRGDDWARSIAADQCQPLAALPGIEWVNLSVDAHPERAAITRQFPSLAEPLNESHSIDDTAALIEYLDAVVSIDSVVAHVALSIGTPTFVLLPTMNDWRWETTRDSHPWWPDATTFRATLPTDFRAAIAHAAHAIEGLLARPDLT